VYVGNGRAAEQKMIYLVALSLGGQKEVGRPSLTHVFGIEVGRSNPSVLVKKYGEGAQEIRDFPSRNDGWNYWKWSQGKADVQAYWSPASPDSKRVIVRIRILEPFKSKSHPNEDHLPVQKGWLGSIRIGMRSAELAGLLAVPFGKPKLQFGQAIWTSKTGSLAASFEKDKLYEISIDSSK